MWSPNACHESDTLVLRPHFKTWRMLSSVVLPLDHSLWQLGCINTLVARVKIFNFTKLVIAAAISNFMKIKMQFLLRNTNSMSSEENTSII